MQLIFDLLQQTAVIVVIAYLFSKSPAMRYFSGERLQRRELIVLYFVFVTFSILGTYFGLPIKGAIANTRATGAVLAGLIGGPFLGTTVGITAGIHRYFLGGFTAFSCGLSTTFEGFLGGMVHLFLIRRNRPEQVYSPLVAFVTTICAEIGQMLIILALSRPFTDALALVQAIALPMIAANGVGAALFLSMVRDQRKMRDEVGARFSAKALNVANRTLDIISRGFNIETAGQLAEILHKETGVGAVAITDREKVLAFTGLGADHHSPGHPIRSPLTKAAIQDKKVVFADGHQTVFRCPVEESCLLGSVLIVPLKIGQDVIGTIELFEPTSKIFLNINRTFGEGLTTLFSHHLLRARYEEQKNLLIESELKLIQAQVNPHFLFNALNTIIAIVRKDADQARSLLMRLSTFLRTNLKRKSDIVSLGEELEQIGAYLEIEKARFGERLQVDIVVDEHLRGLRVPVFTFQPLIENAIKHGISTLLGGGIIQIHASEHNGVANVFVDDNAGNYCEKLKNQGLGLNLVDKRIKNLYGSSYGVSIDCEPQQRTSIKVRIPTESLGKNDARIDH